MLFVKTFIKNIHIYANISTTPKNTPCIMISLIHLVLTRINDQQSDFKKRALPILCPSYVHDIKNTDSFHGPHSSFNYFSYQ